MVADQWQRLIFYIFNDFFLFFILKSMNKMKFKRRELFEGGLGLSHMRNQKKCENL